METRGNVSKEGKCDHLKPWQERVAGGRVALWFPAVTAASGPPLSLYPEPRGQ